MEQEKARGLSRRLVTRRFAARVLVPRSLATRINKQEASYQVHMGHASYVVLGTTMVKVLCSDKTILNLFKLLMNVLFNSSNRQ